MDSTPVSPYVTYSSTMAVGGSKCRWCGEQDGLKTPYSILCEKCGALVEPVISLGAGLDKGVIKIYHNPDNSVFFEFSGLDNKNTRYVLDPAVLMKMGLLQTFDTPPDGKK